MYPIKPAIKEKYKVLTVVPIMSFPTFIPEVNNSLPFNLALLFISYHADAIAIAVSEILPVQINNKTINDICLKSNAILNE